MNDKISILLPTRNRSRMLRERAMRELANGLEEMLEKNYWRDYKNE